MPQLIARFRESCLLLAIALTAACATAEAPQQPAKSSSYQDLVTLFEEWREFQKPRQADGVSDYTAEAMAAQYEELGAYRQRLEQIDPSGWPVPQQVDHKIVQAEMNGMDFDHRVRRPWARNPAFYSNFFLSRSDVPAHEGPSAFPSIDVWTYQYPLDEQSAAELTAQIGSIPKLLDQARGNLVEDARGLWMGGIRQMGAQSAALQSYASQVAGREELASAVEQARQASDAFKQWLEEQLPSKTGPSGVGKENYSWYLQKVHMVPFSWEEEVTLMRRELARAHSSLRLEEHRNRNLPPLKRIDSPEEYERRLNQSVDDYMAFLKDQEIITIRDDMDPALRARLGSFVPSDGLRGFFSEVNYRSPLAMRTHMHHWIELAKMDNDPHPNPIRRRPLLYNIFDGRSEGLATGVEEMLMHAGLFDGKPRERELIWIMLAQRAARALSGLHLHSNDYSMEQACEFASKWTPRGWMPEDSDTCWFEQHLYLQQPGYGTSYLIGKIEIENLMAERALQLGEEFSIKRFMDEFRAAGLIPVSLIRWELTGHDDQIRRMEQ